MSENDPHLAVGGAGGGPGKSELVEVGVLLSDRDQILQEENERLSSLSIPDKNEELDETETEDLDQETKYKKLIELLTRSQFYTEFLVKKIEGQHQSIEKNKINRKTRSQGLKSPLQDLSPNHQSGSALSPTKGADQMINIAADIIDSKKRKLEENDPTEKEDYKVLEEPEGPSTKTLDSGLVVPFNQPDLLIGTALRDYQMEGLKWLRILYENGVNGILADEMGLGKTIQVIALIAHLVERNTCGPFLIIGPLSTLPNWLIEFERFTPELPVILYHGNEKTRNSLKNKFKKKVYVRGRRVYPIIVTSYEYPLHDAKFLRRFAWKYIIIDEGHRIKNHRSQLSRVLRTYESANRLLLTGTPLHNSLTELWALLNFLIPEIFDNLAVFESWFDVIELENEQADKKILEEEGKNHILSTMHKILSPFLLRRLKSDVNLNLPPKKELIVYAPMSPIQLDLYKATLDYNITKLTRQQDKSSVIIPDVDGKRPKRKCTESKKNYNFSHRDEYFSENSNSSIADFNDPSPIVIKDKESKDYAVCVKMQNTVMMLRKIVNHPYLVQYPLIPGTEYVQIDERIVETSGKLLVLDAMLSKLKARGSKVLLFSTFTTMLDVIEDYLSLRDYKYTRLDGRTDLTVRQENIKAFNTDPDMFLFLISTRAGGLGINLAAADTVILYDSDWNPQVDLQAQDRCHRIGQTRPVVVYRYITAGTVDEKIVVRGTAKRKLEKLIINNGHYKKLNIGHNQTVDLEELQKLLNSRDHQRVIHSNGYVFSDAELDEILDRSDMMNNNPTLKAEGDIVKARSFKEYYGYTGVKRTEGAEDTSPAPDENCEDMKEESGVCSSASSFSSLRSPAFE